MNFVSRWYNQNVKATPEQTKLFFYTLPVFLLISFFIAKSFMVVSFLWFILYCVLIVGTYDDRFVQNKPAFPYASKYPKANAIVHSFYFSWAVMGLCWMPINQFFIDIV